MIYEIIGKVALYIIGTLLYGIFISCLNDDEDVWSVFFGAWLASIIVFLELIVKTP